MGTELTPHEYAELLGFIKNRIRAAQYQALKAVNSELIDLCWDIGALIVERQKGDTWGKSVVERLSQDLQREFPGIKGFSPSGLWRMKMFYQTYRDKPNLAPLVREIGWTHNIIILEKCKDDAQREFYLRMTARCGWSKTALIEQIESRAYEKSLLSQTNFEGTLPPALQDHARLAIKPEYIFDFLDLGEEHTESEIKQALTLRLERFLSEMGGLFTFVGSRYPLRVSDREFFIDLLLYHRLLRCLVAVDLNVGEFQPEFVGRMQFYLAALNDRVRLPGENPSIGIILCKSKDKTIVEYALRDSTKPIGVAEYRVSPRLPSELEGQLPGPEQIGRLLEAP